MSLANSETSLLKNVISLLVPIFLTAPPAVAEIFKCVGKNAADVYQNFPCSVDSIGSMPSAKAPRNAPETSQSVGAAPAGRPPLSPIAQPAPRVMASGNEVQLGATSDEVRAMWGEPEEIVQDEPPSGRIEIWKYADAKIVHINVKKRVISIQR